MSSVGVGVWGDIPTPPVSSVFLTGGGGIHVGEEKNEVRICDLLVVFRDIWASHGQTDHIERFSIPP